MTRAREYLQMIDEIQDDLEEYQREALRLLSVNIPMITLITVLGYHLGDSTALIMLYLGWCVYVAFWALFFHSRTRSRRPEN